MEKRVIEIEAKTDDAVKDLKKLQNELNGVQE